MKRTITLIVLALSVGSVAAIVVLNRSPVTHPATVVVKTAHRPAHKATRHVKRHVTKPACPAGKMMTAAHGCWPKPQSCPVGQYWVIGAAQCAAINPTRTTTTSTSTPPWDPNPQPPKGIHGPPAGVTCPSGQAWMPNGGLGKNGYSCQRWAIKT